jgi:tetratricopeptide (TPR) repeat protein
LNLPGLAYPDEETAAAASTYSAGQLFLERSHNHGVILKSEPPVNTAVQHLCRLVEGLPLALELAAAWTGKLSLPVINAEIEREIAFLTTNMHDVPPRHRSIRAVFDTSWQLLDEAERLLTRRLSYFRGGFSQEAAAEVTGATPALLQSLSDKSLLRPQADGRYQMHELIRQYAAEKLAQQPVEAEQVARGHGRFFANFLAERETTIQGADYLQAKDEIQADIENVRQAWEWLVAHRSLDDVTHSAETLHYYYINTQGLFAEAAHRFQTAADEILQANQTDEAEQLAGRLWLQAAVNRRMLGQLADAARLAQQSLAIFYQHELPKDIARASGTLSVIRLQQNDKETALSLAETAVDQARELEDPITLCLCLNNLSYVISYNGTIEAAIAIAEESAALAKQIAYPHGLLSAMNMLGVYYEQIGEIEKAEAVFKELVDRCRETATRSRLAQAVNNLGMLHKKRGQLDEARPLLQEAASLYEAVGQTHYATAVQVMLGEIALAQSEVDQARRLGQQALQAAQEIEMPALTLDVLAFHADLLRDHGDHEEAASLLAFVAYHPAGLGDTGENARQALEILRKEVSPQALAVAEGRGSAWTFNEAVAEALRLFQSG